MNLKIGKSGAVFLSAMLISVGVFGAVNLLIETPPTADAGVDQIVEPNTVVQFDGSESKGDDLNYTWYFRTNGNGGYGVNPTHTFTEEGIYEVGLLVREAESNMMHLDITKITVRNQIPIADAGPEQIVNEDDEVIFDASGTMDTDSDLPTLLYDWKFGDGKKGIGINPTNIYTQTGTYTAILTVTDDGGAVGTDTVTITVNNPSPTAKAGSAQTVNEGELVYFDGSGSTDTPSDADSLRYEWNFGDLGPYAANYWKDNGVYPATLTVTDDDGAQDQNTIDISVQNVDPFICVDDAYLVANVTLRASGEKWHDVKLYLNESGTPKEEFYVYREPGDPKEQEDTRDNMKLNLGELWTAEVYYTPLDDPINGQLQGATPIWIILEFDNGVTRKISHNFNVENPESWYWNVTLNDYFFQNPQPSIHFGYTIYDPGMDSETVTWECGDKIVTKHYEASTFPTLIKDTIDYTPKKMQNITITVDDDDGGTYNVTLAFSESMLDSLAPKVSAGDDVSAVEDSPVTFSGSAKTTVSRTIASYRWEFGDGASTTGASAEHIYTFSGTYYAALRAWDDLGNVGIDIVKVEVANANPFAEAGLDQDVSEDSIVIFDGSGSTDTPSDAPFLVYEWNFGDGNVGYGLNPIHVYSDAGTYTVTLTVIDNDGATSTDTVVVTVYNLAPTAALAGPDRIIYGAPMSIEFIGVGFDTFSDVLDLTYSWDFGDENLGTGKVTSHTYTVASTYTVTLTVRDDNLAVATDTCTIHVGIDSDGDNLGDAFEIDYGTIPSEWDSDGDYISDYWEIYTYDTEPMLSDTDDDGLIDWYEIAYLGYDVDVDDDDLMCPRDWDSDGDWIKDGEDPNPLVYNHADGTEASEDEIISVDNELGVSVIIDYDGVSTVKAEIVEITPAEELNMPVGPYLSISTTSTETYTAEIRIRVPDSLPAGASEERLAMYQWDYGEGKWLIAEKTGVDLTYHYIWAETSDLSQWGNGDSDYEDSDEDGLTDWCERTTYYPIVSYDFEASPQGWTTMNDGIHLWELQSDVVHSGSKAWHAGGWYMRGSFLISPWVDLGVAKEPRLSLWQRSGSAGAFIDLTHVKVYTATSAKHLGNLPSSVNTWGSGPVIYDLSEYEGETVQIEFYFYGYETSDHRYVDDVLFEGKTDELIDDSDGDKLNDGDEVNIYSTYPLVPDTDGDGSYDGVEVFFSDKTDTNPLVAEATVAVSISGFNFNDVDYMLYVNDLRIKQNPISLAYPYTGTETISFGLDIYVWLCEVWSLTIETTITLDANLEASYSSGVHSYTFQGTIIYANSDEPPWGPLARKLAPHLVFEDLNQEYPTSIFFDGNRNLADNGEPTVDPHVGGDNDPATGTGYYDLSFSQKMEKTTVYMNAYKDGDLFGIQYWFYYVYHDDPQGGPRHKHDWWYFWVVYDTSAHTPKDAIFDFHHNLRSIPYTRMEAAWYSSFVKLDGGLHAKVYLDAGGHRAMYAPGEDINVADMANIYLNGLQVLWDDGSPWGDEIFGAMLEGIDAAAWRDDNWDEGRTLEVEDFNHWVWVYDVNEDYPYDGNYDNVRFTGDNILPWYDETTDVWPTDGGTRLPWNSGISWADPYGEDPLVGVTAISSTEMVWKWKQYQWDDMIWNPQTEEYDYTYDWTSNLSPSIFTRYYDGTEP